jgi:hypothetical protein
LFKIKHLAQAVKVLSQGDRANLSEPAKCTNKRRSVNGVQTQRHAASKRMAWQARDGGEKAALQGRSHGKAGAQRQERQVR